MARVLFLFQIVFRKLGFLPYLPLEEEMINLVQRGFMDVGLDSRKDVLTNYEVKVFVTTLISNSKRLVHVLGINEMGVSSNISTFQRNKMSALTLLLQGMIGQNTCKYRLHYESTRFKPQLEPRKKQEIHERALAMGDEDPLKIDFSKFIAKPEKKGKGKVEPLDHGHLLYIKYIEGVWPLLLLQLFSFIRSIYYYSKFCRCEEERCSDQNPVRHQGLQRPQSG